jgi:cytochrome b561
VAFVIPALPKSAIIQHTALLVHVFTGQWLVYGLILLHLTAAIWHVAVKRDGVLDRMLPPQNRDLRV